MADDQTIERVRQSIEKRRARPAEERWDELVRRGAIDARGRVLLGGIEPSKRPDSAKGAKAR